MNILHGKGKSSHSFTSQSPLKFALALKVLNLFIMAGLTIGDSKGIKKSSAFLLNEKVSSSYSPLPFVVNSSHVKRTPLGGHVITKKILRR